MRKDMELTTTMASTFMDTMALSDVKTMVVSANIPFDSNASVTFLIPSSTADNIPAKTRLLGSLIVFLYGFT